MLLSTRWALALTMAATAAAAQNLYSNPDFNDGDGIAGWTLWFGALAHHTVDASDCPGSGSLQGIALEVMPQQILLNASGPCVPFAEPTEIAVSFRYSGEVGSAFDNNSVSALAFPNGDCDGAATEVAGVSFQNVDWTLYSGTLSVPAGGSMQWHVGSGGQVGAGLRLDEIRATMQPHVFLDDFEGGGTCRWSTTVP